MKYNKKFLNKTIQLICAGVFILSSQDIIAAESGASKAGLVSGAGIIPAISGHYKTLPSFYDFDKMPAEHITSSIDRRFIMGTQSTVIRWDVKAGTKLPLHFHINEQITYVMKGVLEASSQGEKYILKAGQIMVFPPNVPHEFVAIKDTIIVEFNTPARQDFINGDFEKAAAKMLNKDK